jgi:hypothetical protein
MDELRGERDAVKLALLAGKSFGYGNVISRLRVAWALSLIEKCDISVRAACSGALMAGYDASHWINMENSLGKDEAVLKMRHYAMLD